MKNVYKPMSSEVSKLMCAKLKTTCKDSDAENRPTKSIYLVDEKGHVGK